MINRLIQLDVYLLPHIDEMVSEIAKYRTYSTLNLQSTYHNVEIKPDDRPYTAFKANGCLYHFQPIPFSVSFQRIIDNIISTEKLKNTFAYI